MSVASLSESDCCRKQQHTTLQQQCSLSPHVPFEAPRWRKERLTHVHTLLFCFQSSCVRVCVSMFLFAGVFSALESIHPREHSKEKCVTQSGAHLCMIVLPKYKKPTHQTRKHII